MSLNFINDMYIPVGHTNIHITLDTYADVFDRMNLGAISKFEDYIDKVLQEE